MAVLGEKLGGGPADHSARLGVASGALFLGSSRVRPTLLVTCERLPRVMLVGFFPATCTLIQITVTLGYE
jgi:hypothetical protein